jgi:glutaminase
VRGIEVCRKFARDFALHPHRARTSTVDVVRRRYTGQRVRSTRVRSLEECEALEAHGDAIVVFELQGNLYFADAEQLIRRVLANIDDARVVILDGQRVRRVDPPAVTLLIGLADTIIAHERTLVTAGFPTAPDGALDLGGITAADVDDALEWWEERVLAEAFPGGAGRDLPLASQELLRGMTSEHLAAIEDTVSVEELGIGTYLAREGDASDCVYFLLSGQVSVRLPIHDRGGDGHANAPRLAGFGPGAAVGELALLDESPRSADLVVDRPTRVAVLSVRDLDDLDSELPGLKATLYANLAHSLSERLRRANGRIRALEQ